MQALVLAGGNNGIQGMMRGESASKADLPVGERPMVEHVVAALQAVPAIERVTVARGTGDSMTANLLQAVETLDLAEDEYLLISACDIPFLTPGAIDDFLENCIPGSHVYYPIVRRAACEQRFPGVKRTYARLREGTFTGGNLFLVQVKVLQPLAELIERFFLLRKSPLRLAQLLGYGLLGRFLLSSLFGTLPLHVLERRVEELAGIRAKAVISNYAEIGTDIDKVGDLILVNPPL